MDVQIRGMAEADVGTCGRICYAAFKDIADCHHFRPDFPSPEIAIQLTQFLHANPQVFSVVAEANDGLGAWPTERIVAAIRDGRRPHRRLTPIDMPWPWLHALTDEDATAIATYLKTLPPVRNTIPAPLQYGVLETIVMKLTRPWPAFLPEVLVFVDGNFGRRQGEDHRNQPQAWLITLQWTVLIVGLVAFIMAGPRGRRLPRTVSGWLLTGLVVLGMLSLGLLAAGLYSMPALRILPSEQIAQPSLLAIPTPAPSQLGNAEQAALMKRGRYLFTVASCALCHRPDGSGGFKISWKAFGSLWTRNITSDPGTGIGRWSDREIARAVRSGVTPDGRMLHWQGMIWDHASNWDEEDLRALVAYLRVLPPCSVPFRQPDRPPRMIARSIPSGSPRARSPAASNAESTSGRGISEKITVLSRLRRLKHF